MNFVCPKFSCSRVSLILICPWVCSILCIIAFLVLSASSSPRKSSSMAFRSCCFPAAFSASNCLALASAIDARMAARFSASKSASEVAAALLFVVAATGVASPVACGAGSRCASPCDGSTPFKGCAMASPPAFSPSAASSSRGFVRSAMAFTSAASCNASSSSRRYPSRTLIALVIISPGVCGSCQRAREKAGEKAREGERKGEREEGT
mmetsp:Transcript_19272/g.46253  ORF Transcript_19272/g.46253 Transcript_19272/m.46253 type:complete len:209 (+) Transcript_19272:544-1170(+)